MMKSKQLRRARKRRVKQRQNSTFKTRRVSTKEK
jgi:hypothetical protein